MSRTLRVAVASLALALPGAALAQDASTTRIETRNFYGATVTLESGVRVFRPLPPHSKVIINPGGATPLHLSVEEHRSHNYYHDQSGARPVSGEPASAAAGGYYPGAYGTYPRNGRRGDHVQGHGYDRPADRTSGGPMPRRGDPGAHHGPGPGHPGKH